MVTSEEMFMLFFSILYGIMLNSLIGRGVFPITSALSCEDLVGEKENGEPEWGKGKTSWKRLLLSIAILNIAPFGYFAVAFQFIDFIGEPSIAQIFSIGLISMSVFAFYYFFLGLAIMKVRGKPVFYTQFHYEKQYKKKVFYPSLLNHMVAGLLYLILPWLLAWVFKVIGLLH